MQITVVAHGVLSGIDVCQHRRQRPVVPDGARQYVRDAVPFAGVQNAVFDLLRFQKGGNRSVEPHPVDGVQMVVVPVGLTFLRVDVLPQGSVEVGCLQIMGGQRIPGQQGIHIAIHHELGEGCP